MGLRLEAVKVPIHINEHGVALVGGTRVHLETVIAAFHRGETPEQVIDSYDVLSLADENFLSVAGGPSGDLDNW